MDQSLQKYRNEQGNLYFFLDLASKQLTVKKANVFV